MGEKDLEEKSEHWDSVVEQVKTLPKNGRLPGFPFNEKWPRQYAGQTHELILVTGERVEATVDDSKEFSAEGLQWRCKSNGSREKSVVAAWRRIS